MSKTSQESSCINFKKEIKIEQRPQKPNLNEENNDYLLD